MTSSSVRVEKETLAKLKVISSEEKRPIGQIVTDLVARYEKERFWRAMHDSFSRLREDPAAWKAYEAEAEVWQRGTADALGHEEPYYTPEEEAEINAGYERSKGR